MTPAPLNLDAEQEQMLEDLHKRAVLYTEQGKLDQAELLFQQALVIARKVHGDDHAAVAPKLRNLANLLQNQDELAQAEPLFQ